MRWTKSKGKKSGMTYDNKKNSNFDDYNNFYQNLLIVYKYAGINATLQHEAT